MNRLPLAVLTLAVAACGTDETSTLTADVGADSSADATADALADAGSDAAPSGPLAVFVTSGVAAGGGIAGLDAYCNESDERPDANASYAALVMGPSRRACTTPNCEGGADPLDWPLLPDQAYAQGDVTVFTTDANAIVSAVPSGLLQPEGFNVWSGATAEWTVLENTHCNDWTSGAEADEGGLGWTGGPPIVDFLGGHGQWGCHNATPVICVERP